MLGVGGPSPCGGSAGDSGGFVSPQKARLLRSRSFCHQEIENLLANDHRELIGDFSKVRGWRPGGAAPPEQRGALTESPVLV